MKGVRKTSHMEQPIRNYAPVAVYTAEAYLHREREAEYRSEFVNGQIIAMAGGSVNHNAVKENLSYLVAGHFRKGKKCRSYSSDQRVHANRKDLYCYPDLVAVCRPNQYTDEKHDTLMNPVLIGEVLSPGTEAYDRGEKFWQYRTLDSLNEYVLIDSTKIRAEVYRRNEQNVWYIADEADTLEGTLMLASIDLVLPMSEVYTNTENLAA